MDYLDRIIPLAVLGAAGLALLYLVFRRTHEREPRTQANAIPLSEPRLAEVALPAVAPFATEPVASVTAVIPPPPKVERVKPESRQEVAREATPVHAVLDMLKKEDALSAAFVLGEVLGPPVARRRQN